ncbi:ketosteroid isomerase [bacterium endosymbiont of Escarpia laminata]|nr:MAG: ketosteroid isomerase [bacterium endosymbiont of Escarpia laminata]RLJ22804.1 MAG: ketosteroid isomerase [bacterium endosymbiont of Escarpia laminata]
MSNNFESPQDAEDAYYDAIDEMNLEAMMAVWEESDEVLCLLPMSPAQRGLEAIRKVWEPMLSGDMVLNMEIKHLSWIETDDIAIHLIKEIVKIPGAPETQPVYATNIYRRGGDGWRILMHQNSPTPPAQGIIPPTMQR